MTPSRELRGVMEQILRHNPAISPGDPEIICGKTHGRPGFGYPCGRQTSTDAVSGVTVLSTDHDRRQTFDHRNHRCVCDWYPLICGTGSGGYGLPTPYRAYLWAGTMLDHRSIP